MIGVMVGGDHTHTNTKKRMGFQKLGWWRSPAVYLVMDAVVSVVVLALVVKVGLY